MCVFRVGTCGIWHMQHIISNESVFSKLRCHLRHHSLSIFFSCMSITNKVYRVRSAHGKKIDKKNATIRVKWLNVPKQSIWCTFFCRNGEIMWVICMVPKYRFKSNPCNFTIFFHSMKSSCVNLKYLSHLIKDYARWTVSEKKRERI